MKSVPPDPSGSLCSGSCGFPSSDPDVTRIPAFAPFGRRYAERSDILHCLTRISRKRGFDPGRSWASGAGCAVCARAWLAAQDGSKRVRNSADPRSSGSCAPVLKRLRQLKEENVKLKRIVTDLSLDEAMLRDVLSKNSEACRQAQACRHDQGGPEGFDTPRLRRVKDRSVTLCLQVQARRGGRTEAEDQGHLPDTGTVWLPSCKRSAEA